MFQQDEESESSLLVFRPEDAPDVIQELPKPPPRVVGISESPPGVKVESGKLRKKVKKKRRVQHPPDTQGTEEAPQNRPPVMFQQDREPETTSLALPPEDAPNVSQELPKPPPRVVGISQSPPAEAGLHVKVGKRVLNQTKGVIRKSEALLFLSGKPLVNAKKVPPRSRIADLPPPPISKLPRKIDIGGRIVVPPMPSSLKGVLQKRQEGIHKNKKPPTGKGDVKAARRHLESLLFGDHEATSSAECTKVLVEADRSSDISLSSSSPALLDEPAVRFASSDSFSSPSPPSSERLAPFNLPVAAEDQGWLVVLLASIEEFLHR
ncbi:MAG: hypothetical protein KVP17_005141 [Porospora cf. gigantea B]|uniref:uncharacterized protein n=1 Tax=Porospora cf. gigantea B TaxID=2853592 RepID=UPI003571F9C3|nr:MAG: hypothetical protein KVP17_005141 [Porospora cf. gigantea B]